MRTRIGRADVAAAGFPLSGALLRSCVALKDLLWSADSLSPVDIPDDVVSALRHLAGTQLDKIELAFRNANVNEQLPSLFPVDGVCETLKVLDVSEGTLVGRKGVSRFPALPHRRCQQSHGCDDCLAPSRQVPEARETRGRTFS